MGNRKRENDSSDYKRIKKHLKLLEEKLYYQEQYEEFSRINKKKLTFIKNNKNT